MGMNAAIANYRAQRCYAALEKAGSNVEVGQALKATTKSVLIYGARLFQNLSAQGVERMDLQSLEKAGYQGQQAEVLMDTYSSYTSTLKAYGVEDAASYDVATAVAKGNELAEQTDDLQISAVQHETADCGGCLQ